MEYIIKMGVKGMEQESMIWIHVAEDRGQFQAYLKIVINVCVSSTAYNFLSS
jgi:hypothetical protein